MHSKAQYLLKKFGKCMLELGIDPRKMKGVFNYPKYRRDRKKFVKTGGKITHNFMVLNDYNTQAGSASGHYFHQDLLVANFIHKNNPERHIDIGSRIDGFVAHVASFRPIEVFDVRSLKDTGHENIIFTQSDLMNDESFLNEITDSLSCLHVVEHFGLGRYGDPIDPEGHIKGFHNILKMIKPNGRLYISFPIGGKNEIHFNAHRVFHPADILNWPLVNATLKLERFDYVDDEGELHHDIDISKSDITVEYGCGIYTFLKIV